MTAKQRAWLRTQARVKAVLDHVQMTPGSIRYKGEKLIVKDAQGHTYEVGAD